MRLYCLLFIGLVLMGITACHPFIQGSVLRDNACDTLAKYSYLITTTDESQKYTWVSTGFFIRRNDKLFLASAYHVFSGLSLYGGVKPPEIRPASLKVWYRNKAGKIRSESFSLLKFKAREDLRNKVDFDTIDVSSHFTDGSIFSVESMRPDSANLFNVKNDTLVAYGFSHVSKKAYDSIEWLPMPAPTPYLSRVTKTPRSYNVPNKYSQVGIAYFFASPMLDNGASGAPIFRLRTDSAGSKKIEFVGVQSGSDSASNTSSLMVRFGEIRKVL